MFAVFQAKWYTKSMEVHKDPDDQLSDETFDSFVRRITDFTRAIYGDHVIVVDTTQTHSEVTEQFKKAS